MPKHGHAKSAYYLWSECRDWYMARKIDEARPKAESSETPDLVEAQARKYSAEAKRAEIKLARERGEVAAIEDVQLIMQQANANVRARLMAIPGKLTPKLINITSKPKVKAILEKEIDEALGELANPPSVTLPPADEDE